MHEAIKVPFVYWFLQSLQTVSCIAAARGRDAYAAAASQSTYKIGSEKMKSAATVFLRQ